MAAVVEILQSHGPASAAVAEGACLAIAALANTDKTKCRLADVGACEGTNTSSPIEMQSDQTVSMIARGSGCLFPPPFLCSDCGSDAKFWEEFGGGGVAREQSHRQSCINHTSMESLESHPARGRWRMHR